MESEGNNDVLFRKKTRQLMILVKMFRKDTLDDAHVAVEASDDSSEDDGDVEAAESMPKQECSKDAVLANFVRNNFLDIERTKDADGEGVSEKPELENDITTAEPGESLTEVKSWPAGSSQIKKCYSPAKVFGKLNFSEEDTDDIPFIRCAYDDSDETKDAPRNARIFLFKHWDLRRPPLIISIIGGYQQLSLSNEVKHKIIQESILKVVHSTNAWLITCGTNIGISKAVATAAAEQEEIITKRDQGGKNVCIGITAWGTVEKRDDIVRKVENATEENPEVFYGTGLQSAGARNANYLGRQQVKESKAEQMSQFELCDKCTHFLLVDNGFEGKEALAGAIKFKAQLEKSLATGINRKYKGSSTTVVALLIQGGAIAVDEAYETIQQEIPLIVLGGTGKLANLIGIGRNIYRNSAYSIKGIEQQNNMFDDALRRMIQVAFLLEDENDSDYLLEESTGREKQEEFRKREKEKQNWIESCFVKLKAICTSQYVTVIRFDSHKDLDMPILECMVSNSRDASNLQYALLWDRLDIAEKIVESPQFDIENEYPTLMTAILEGKLDFIKLLINVGADIRSFLNESVLETLFVETDEHHAHILLQLGRNKPITSQLFETKLFRMVHCEHKFTNVEKYDDPYQELMIYSVLFNRRELALYFWEHTKRPLLNAVMCARISEGIRKHFKKYHDDNLVENYRLIKQSFEEKAIGLLSVASCKHHMYAQDIVRASARPEWQSESVLDVAASAEAYLFVGHEVCQREIFRKWNFGYHCEWMSFFFCYFFFIPIFFKFAIRFDRNLLIRELREMKQKFDKDGKIVKNIRARFSGRIGGELRRQLLGENYTASERKTLPKLIFYWKPFIFYKSAHAKFMTYSLFYAFYLLLFTCVLLFSNERKHMTRWEILLHFWHFSSFVESANDAAYICKKKNVKLNFGAWIESMGSTKAIDILYWLAISQMTLLRILSFFIPYIFSITRLSMVVSIIIAYFRLFKVAYAVSYLGPKVIMIWKMAQELMLFSVFFIVILFAYGVATQSVIDPHITPYLGVVWDLVFHGVWEIFGELSEERDHVENCQNSTGWEWGISEDNFDCFLRLHTRPILLAIYLFLSNALLLNLLIAAFNSIFDDINNLSLNIWRYHMYFIVDEYDRKFFLPAPLNILYHLFGLCRYFYKSASTCCVRERHRTAGLEVGKTLRSFEKICLSAYLEQLAEETEDDKYKRRLSALENMVESLTSGQKILLQQFAYSSKNQKIEPTLIPARLKLRNAFARTEPIPEPTPDFFCDPEYIFEHISAPTFV